MSASRTLWLLLAVVLGWWFFTGESPMAIVRNFVGRGKKLTTSHLDGNDLVETPEDLLAQVRAATGDDSIEMDDMLVARVIASEDPGGTERAKAAIGNVVLNDARAHGWSVLFTVTVTNHNTSGVLGGQSSRRFATSGGGKLDSREIHEDDLAIARDVRAGVLADTTGAATKFIHYTGYKHLQDFLATRPKVQAWIDAGLTPVDLGGVGVLVVFPRHPELAEGTAIALPKKATA